MHIKQHRLWVLFVLLVTMVGCQATFEEYIKTYDLNFPTAQEYQYRKNIFIQNLIRFQQLAKKSSVQLKINKFMHKTDQELNRTLRTEGPRAINKTTVASSRVNKNPRVFPRVRAVVPPEAFSWSDLGKITPVKDQSVCGSCWSFSSIALIEAYAIIKENRVLNLSEQHGLECNQAGFSCGGGDPTILMMEFLSKGVLYSIDYPYDYRNGHYGICWAPNRYFLPENTAIVMSFESTEQELKELLQMGPMLTLFRIPQGLDFTYYKSGVYTGCRPNIQFQNVDHALLLTGYDTTSYEIKNSWGSSWGQNGFADISKINNCGIGLFNIQLQTCPQGQYYDPPKFPNDYGYLTYTKYINCVACPTSCRTCTSSSVCTGCQSGQYLLYGTCVSQCRQFLIKNNGACLCPQGSFYLNGECPQCSINCKVCSSYSNCTTCLDNFFLNHLTRGCQSSCPLGTQTMPGGVCSCISGTYYDGTGCRACITNCQYCANPHTCNTCNFGYFLNDDKTICSNCSVGCKYCTKSTECLQCQTGFFRSVIDNLCYATCPLAGMISTNGTCSCQNSYDPATSKCIIACPTSCSNCVNSICYACMDGTYLNGTACLSCSTACSTCSSDTACINCFSGYYLANGGCVKCQITCKECTNTGCNSCFDPFILTNGKCACPEGQYNYQDTTCLQTCPVGMSMDPSGKCVCALFTVNGTCRDCPNLCTNCTGAVCTGCVNGSVLKNGSCVCNTGFFSAPMQCQACSTGCKVCNNETFCAQCASNYKQYKQYCCINGSYWNGTGCQKCISNCSDCQSDKCTKCPTTFNLVAGDCVCNSTSFLSNNTCKQCVAPCSTCLNSTNCTSCLNPFIVSKGSCNCPGGFYVSGQVCLNCTVGCTFCTGINQCQQCGDSFYLSFGSCQRCSSNCMKCNETACSVCKVPYVLVSGVCSINNTLNPNSVPQAYGCDVNCNVCYSFDACYICISGFYITQTLKCVMGTTRIWNGFPIAYYTRAMPLIVLNTSVCAVTTPRNVTLNLPYTTVNDANTIILNSYSQMFIGNAFFNISGSNVIYGQPYMSSENGGLAPNRFTVVHYRHIDCMSNVTNWWSATFFENKTSNFQLMANEVPAGANRYIEVQSGNTSVLKMQAATRSGYSLYVGNPCLESVTNCTLCEPTMNTCRMCSAGNYAFNGSCVKQCPTNYLLVNGVCQQQSVPTTPTTPTVTPTPTASSSDNKDNAVLWIVVGIGSLVLLSALVAILYFCIRKSMLERDNAMSRNIANAAIAASAVQRPVMQSIPVMQPMVQASPVPLIQPQFDNRLSGVIAGAPAYSYQPPYSYRLV